MLKIRNRTDLKCLVWISKKNSFCIQNIAFSVLIHKLQKVRYGFLETTAQVYMNFPAALLRIWIRSDL